MAKKQLTPKSIFLAAVAFLVTAGILFGGEVLAERLLKENPLQQWAGAVPEIKEFALQADGGKLLLHLQMNKSENLRKTLEPFIREIRERKNKELAGIIIESPCSERLQEVYYELSFVLEEARISGKYQDLYAKLRELEAKHEGDFKVFIGEEFFFVQLAKGDDLYYQAVSRFCPVNAGEDGKVVFQ